MPRERTTRNADPKNVYIGIDVHLKQWNVCVYQGGLRRKSFQQPPEAASLQSYLQRVYPGMSYYSAYEAGVCGCSIHYDLESHGIHNVIFNAADVSQTHKERVRKTDSVDAAKIARSLANGDLRCVHIPPQWRMADRNLLRLRSTRVSDMKRQKSRLRHYLHVNGIIVPPEYGPGHWPQAFFRWLKETAESDGGNTGQALGMMIGDLEIARNELRHLDRRLLALMKMERYSTDYDLLRSVPGVGPRTAICLLIECGDLTDFGSAEAFCAYVGLIPDMDRSDEHDGHCGITRRRHKVLRYMLTECAWRAIRSDDHLSGLYAAYSRRMPSNKAIVKVANKLAKIIKFVLKNKRPYAKPE